MTTTTTATIVFLFNRSNLCGRTGTSAWHSKWDSITEVVMSTMI